MTGNSLIKITQQVLLMYFVLKNENISCLHLKTKFKLSKTNHCFIDSKRRRMALSSSQKISALLRGITSKHDGDFYCLKRLHSFRIKNKLIPCGHSMSLIWAFDGIKIIMMYTEAKTSWKFLWILKRAHNEDN